MTAKLKIQFVDIKGYDLRYKLSNYGDVYVKGAKKWLKLKTFEKNKGYLFVHLKLNGKYKNVRVHRLVATYFIDNPDNLDVVNHKDENKHNNRSDNLEWCDLYYNINYGNSIGKEIPVEQYDKEGNFIARYRSVAEASRQTGIRNLQKRFRKYINSKRKTLFGYVWKEI